MQARTFKFAITSEGDTQNIVREGGETAGGRQNIWKVVERVKGNKTETTVA